MPGTVLDSRNTEWGVRNTYSQTSGAGFGSGEMCQHRGFGCRADQRAGSAAGMDSRGRWTDMAKVGEGDDSGQETQDGLESVISIPGGRAEALTSERLSRTALITTPLAFPLTVPR